MSKLVTIYGGSGFVGRYIARRMAQQDWRVRVAVRHPHEAGFVRTYGVVGQVEPVFCNVRDDDSVNSVVGGSDAVVNCVGILAERRRQTFEAVQSQGAARIARTCANEGVPRLVQLSAIGADENSPSEYARTKAAGEQAVLDAFPDAMILRPSIVFGPEDDFFNRFAGMTRLSPVLPVVGAKTRFQPVYADDVARAAVMGVLGQAGPGIYELGGPDMQTFRELMVEMLQLIQKRRMVVNVPFGVASLMGRGFDGITKATGGLVTGPLTRDQVANLRADNVPSGQYPGLKELGIDATAMEAVLPEYLWRFRPGGQYAAIKDSAKNFRRTRS
ncbi:complex I NDUFA9 subunit family protein [Tranquillimonas rosea]|uniref:complex I NDUFA9 subunit family protein n=1 Tax=Tranquillimonas rosea TaxID=641238 RepID=UPI003BA8E226